MDLTLIYNAANVQSIESLTHGAPIPTFNPLCCYTYMSLSAAVNAATVRFILKYRMRTLYRCIWMH
ncbi:hypothetical protein MKHDV_02753 [Halodesulfovibrio sp. MK-HDV]|nr:hypothetical protein MKHDV_02753 [Halodesulfovibrio sp. MK-HDV]